MDKQSGAVIFYMSLSQTLIDFYTISYIIHSKFHSQNILFTYQNHLKVEYGPFLSTFLHTAHLEDCRTSK